LGLAEGKDHIAKTLGVVDHEQQVLWNACEMVEVVRVGTDFRGVEEPCTPRLPCGGHVLDQLQQQARFAAARRAGDELPFDLPDRRVLAPCLKLAQRRVAMAKLYDPVFGP
jgi:hypothetical protein